LPGHWFEPASKQLHQGRFAIAVGAEERDAIIVIDTKGETPQHGAAWLIAHGNIVERDDAFGDCLVNSLYAVYERAADGFAERYLAMLAAGGTKHHSELLAPFGLDARDPAFWQGGLGVIERMIAELEGLG
jgi:hypothetical protein